MPARLAAEVVTLRITQTTTFGQSVFVTGPLPELGGGSMVNAIKLSPHRYPDWEAQFELPPGVTFQPTFYLRNDAANQLGSAANGTVIPSTTVVQTSAAQAVGKPIVLEGAPTGLAVTAVITSDEAGFTPVNLPFVEVGGGRYEATIPAVHVSFRRLLRISYGATQLPADGPVRLNPAPTWFRFGHAFLYPPTQSSDPTAPFLDEFSFDPQAFTFQTRTIRVWLPRDYSRNTAKRYPVLYAQDGQNIFAPGGPFGNWNMDTSIAGLIRRGEVPEVIVVGINNTSDRFAEYTPEYGTVQGVQGRGREYLRMVRDELMPLINARYRTLTGPENTGHIGSSLGGLLGYDAAVEFRQTFGTVAALSPSSQVATATLLTMADLPPAQRARLWMDCGTSNDGYTNTVQLRDALLASDHVLGPAFRSFVANGGTHSEGAWAARLPEVLRWTFQPAVEALAVTPTPTPTPSPSPSPSPSQTSTATPTATASVTPSATPSPSATASPTATPSPILPNGLFFF